MKNLSILGSTLAFEFLFLLTLIFFNIIDVNLTSVLTIGFIIVFIKYLLVSYFYNLNEIFLVSLFLFIEIIIFNILGINNLVVIICLSVLISEIILINVRYLNKN